MLRCRRFNLEVDLVLYSDDQGNELAIPTYRLRTKALENCNDLTGKFQIGNLNGKITRIFFGGFSRIPITERGDYIRKLDLYAELETVGYTFRQWVKEGKPLILSLKRTKEYSPYKRVK